MNKKDINKLIEAEGRVVFIKKKTQETFLESFLSNSVSVFSAFYFFYRKKYDILLVTKKRMLLVNRGKICFEQRLGEIKSLKYNGIKSVLEITNQRDELEFVKLNYLNLTYEEGKLLKRELVNFR